MDFQNPTLGAIPNLGHSILLSLLTGWEAVTKRAPACITRRVTLFHGLRIHGFPSDPAGFIFPAFVLFRFDLYKIRASNFFHFEFCLFSLCPLGTILPFRVHS